MMTLREKMKQEMTLRGFSSGTQAQYLRAVITLHKHYNRSPALLTEEEVKAYLLGVISNKKIADSTYNVMLHGLKFFYEIVLGKKMVEMNLPRKRQSQLLPDILSCDEVRRIIKATPNLKHRTILIVIYGAGLRASEVGRLAVKDIDAGRMQIHIRSGKGNKDRYVILSPFMLRSLRDYWKSCRSKPSCDAAHPESKSEDRLIFQVGAGKPLSSFSVAAIYKRSKQQAGITKRGGVHSLRHAFATHALESGTDLFVIKQLLGHASISSTVRYLRMTQKTLEALTSPVDRLDL